uniref:Uncharacterized protein n=1 Tax=Cucumis melo TaxID=3656 RepID=A0A9I9EDD1_CUCME
MHAGARGFVRSYSAVGSKGSCRGWTLDKCWKELQTYRRSAVSADAGVTSDQPLHCRIIRGKKRERERERAH